MCLSHVKKSSYGNLEFYAVSPIAISPHFEKYSYHLSFLATLSTILFFHVMQQKKNC